MFKWWYQFHSSIHYSSTEIRFYIRFSLSFRCEFCQESYWKGKWSPEIVELDISTGKYLPQVHFSTSSRSPSTHWKQTVFFLPRLYSVQEGKCLNISIYKSIWLFLGEEINGKLLCQRHPHEKRGLIIHLHVFDSKFKFYLE